MDKREGDSDLKTNDKPKGLVGGAAGQFGRRVSGTFHGLGGGMQTYIRSGRMAVIPRNPANDGQYNPDGNESHDEPSNDLTT